MPIPPPPRPRSILEKTLTLATIGMGVGFGTCGLVVLTRAGEGRWANLAIAGSVLFFLSFGVAAVTFILFAIQQLRAHFRKRDDQ